jgi:cytochrome c peroxidase
MILTAQVMPCHDWHRRGSRCTALLILNLSTRVGSQHHDPPKRHTVPTIQKARWAMGLSWTGKAKFTIEQAMKVQRGSRGIALLFL